MDSRLTEKGTVVVLERVDGAWPGVTATVVGAHDGRTTVDLGCGVAHGLDADLDVVVSAVASDQVVRQRAHAHRTGDLVELVPLEEARSVCRRLRPRCRAALPVSLVDFDHTSGPMAQQGETVDLGPGGCRVWVPDALPAGCDPTLLLTLPSGQRVVTETTVVERITVSWGFQYRLLFSAIDGDAEAALDRFARSAR